MPTSLLAYATSCIYLLVLYYELVLEVSTTYAYLIELVRSYTHNIYIILVFVKEGGRRARAKGEPKGGRRGKDARITQAALCRLRNSAM